MTIYLSEYWLGFATSCLFVLVLFIGIAVIAWLGQRKKRA